jgi:serine phosphatase RsbU (regulator of sigma subunit)
VSVWYKLRRVIRNNLPITIVIIAAVLLELTMATMYYSAQSIIRNTMQKLVEREMDAEQSDDLTLLAIHYTPSV